MAERNPFNLWWGPWCEDSDAKDMAFTMFAAECEEDKEKEKHYSNPFIGVYKEEDED